MELKCIAIDDEPLALEIISAYIEKVPFLKLLRTFDNAIESIDFLRKNKVDLMFLDIEMESLSGIQLIHALNDRPEVIFTTAYDSYAVEGFELDAADYLLKPISFERFVKSVDKVYNKLVASRPKAESHPPAAKSSGSPSAGKPPKPASSTTGAAPSSVEPPTSKSTGAPQTKTEPPTPAVHAPASAASAKAPSITDLLDGRR